MLSNLNKISVFAVLSIILVSTQFGCKSPAVKELAKNPAAWAAVVSAISAGTAVRAEVRQSDAAAQAAKNNQQSNEVLVTLSVPTQASDGTIIYSQPILAYVDCQDIRNDSAIIERNHISYDSQTPLTPENQRAVADIIRQAASPECEKKINGK